MPIAVRVVNARHGLIRLAVFQQPHGLGNNAIPVRSHQLHRARFHRLRTLGFVPHHQDRLAQGRAFFLYAARIGDQNVGAPHQIDERNVALRFDKVDVRQIAQMPVHRTLDIRIRVNGVDNLHIRPLRQCGQRQADLLKSFAETFAPVRRNQQQLFVRIQFGPVPGHHRPVLQAIPDVQHGIDAGIASDRNGSRIDSFSDEILRGAAGSGEMQRCQPCGENAVHLLRERLQHIAGAQARFHVAHRNLAIKRTKRAAECGGGIALHEDHAGLLIRQNRFEPGQNSGCRLEKRLARQHDVEVDIGTNLESRQHLVQQAAMLRGYTDPDIKLGCMFSQVKYNGTKLDCFRPGAENKKETPHACSEPAAAICGGR